MLQAPDVKSSVVEMAPVKDGVKEIVEESKQKEEEVVDDGVDVYKEYKK